MGRDTKRQLVDKVNAQVFPPLSFRVFQGIFSQFIRYYSMQFFSLSMIGVIQKMAPVATFVLAYFMLKERLTKMEMMLNVIAISSSILVSVGDHQRKDSNYTLNCYIALFFLILNPIFIGMSAISLRKMKKTSSETLTTWTNIVQSVFMGTVMIITGQSFTYFLYKFSLLDWAILLGMALSVIGAQTTKLYSYQNQAASKLQVMGNLPMVYNFFADIYLFDTHFTAMQYWGIFITLGTFIIDIYMTYNTESDKQTEDKDKGDDRSVEALSSLTPAD